ncbi:MAG TPA: mechanosensitive ion channel family protein [Gammaproteobacteria bacterium]|nr:mechanosensitive ion channel family protein [Gammaproteobacteria bacterium]
MRIICSMLLGGSPWKSNGTQSASGRGEDAASAGSRRPLSLLLVFLFAAAVLPTNFCAASEEKATASDDPHLALDAALADISRLEQASADLQSRVGKAEGLMREVVEKRLTRYRMDLLQQSLDFSHSVADQQENLENYQTYRERAIELLKAQTGRARTLAAELRGRIKLPADDASAADQAAAYSRVFELLHTLDEVYKIYIDSLAQAREFGIDVGELETRVREDLAERAATGSAVLEITVSRMTALRASLAAVPEDTEIKARLGVTTSNVSKLADVMNEVLRMMDGLQMDTSQYRQQLLVVTGQITSDFFDVSVFTNLVVGWGQTLWENLIESGPGLVFKIILFFIIVYVFYRLAGLLQTLTERGFANAQVQPSQLLQRMVLLVVRNTILAIGILIALAQIGISLGPLLAGLGVVGFIVGFALQDTLSNFAAGMLILIYRPFDVDDFIEAGGVSGKVSNMSLVNTTILTFDNQTIIVPNNKIWGDVIRNVTAQKLRRIDMVFGISYSDDIPKTEKLLLDIVSSHEAVLDDPVPMIRLHELGDSSVNFIARPWVKTEDYWETYWAITREVKMRFDEEGVSIPFPQRDVHLYQQTD